MSFDWRAWLEREEGRAAAAKRGELRPARDKRSVTTYEVMQGVAYQLLCGLEDEELDAAFLTRAWRRIGWAARLGTTKAEREA